MKIEEHRLDVAKFIASPNFDQRPIEEEISLIVIHNISLPPNQFGGPHIESLFCNKLNPDDHPYFQNIHQLKVSAHLLIRRNGEIIQFVDFNQRAWHAGKSSYRGKERVNDFSIGIELEGSDFTPFEEKQYEVLNSVLTCLQNHYPKLNSESITGHSDIAPERKTDPGPHFDWAKITR